MRSLGNATDCRAALDRIARIQPGARARWGRMSAHQMLCHLSDSFRLALGERPASSATSPLQRTVVKWFALYVPMYWPKGIPTRPEMEQGRGGTPPSDFARDRADLSGVVERFTAPDRRLDQYPHPMFGPLTDAEWLRWGYLHADHHLRQFGT